MEKLPNFNDFVNEGYSTGDKKALLDYFANSIYSLQHGMPNKSVIMGAKVISDTEVEVEMDFEIVTFKITKVKER
jgi:hypothetical protein